LNLRLNRAIAACGFCSRRAADQLIADGKVKVNGKTVSDFSCLVNLDKDKLTVDGKKAYKRPNQYVLLHKPLNVVSTCKDEYKRKSILNLLPPKLRHLKPAGRLDYDSSGLMLLTNDGTLIQALTHPKSCVEKTYRLIINGRCTKAALQQLAEGIDLGDVKTGNAKVNLLEGNERRSIIEITITEGRNRQLRRECALLGLPVAELSRMSIDKLQLSNLLPGQWRYMTKEEIIALAKKLNLNMGLTKK
jgi:23S rRNA pseudouridine2605 synthase